MIIYPKQLRCKALKSTINLKAIGAHAKITSIVAVQQRHRFCSCCGTMSWWHENLWMIFNVMAKNTKKQHQLAELQTLGNHPSWPRWFECECDGKVILGFEYLWYCSLCQYLCCIFPGSNFSWIHHSSIFTMNSLIVCWKASCILWNSSLFIAECSGDSGAQRSE